MQKAVGGDCNPAEWYPGIAPCLSHSSLSPQELASVLDDAGALLLQPKAPKSHLAEKLFRGQVLRLEQERSSREREVASRGDLPRSSRKPRRLFDEFLDRHAERQARLERERAESGSLAEELRQQPGLRRKWLVRNIRRFQSFGLAEHILETVWRLWHSDPHEAENLSEIALEISEQLGAETYGQGLVHDLRARCLAALGNSRRVLMQRSSVEEVFQAAEYYLNQGTGNPSEEAYFAQLKASWRRGQRRLDEATKLLDRAASIYRSLGDDNREARVLVQKTLHIGAEGRYREAMSILEKLQEKSRELDPRIFFYVHHNYTLLLYEMGRYEEGLERIAEVRRMAEKLGDSLDDQKVGWLHGQLLASVDRLEEAEELFREAKDQLLQSGKGLEAMGPALDLVRLRLDLPTVKQQEIADELLVFFRTREVQQNLLAALLHLMKALQKEEATPELVNEVEAFLDRAQANPSAVFEPTGAG